MFYLAIVILDFTIGLASFLMPSRETYNTIGALGDTTTTHAPSYSLRAGF